jgi:hypothetical protein
MARELVGGHPARAGAIGKELLLSLNAVFHFSVCVVKLLVKRAGCKASVRLPGQPFGGKVCD